MPHCDFRREALPALDCLDNARTPADVVSLMAASLKPFGGEFFCFAMLPKAGQKYEEVMLAHRIPPEWLRLYLEKDFAAVDPSIRHFRHAVQPFEYKDAPYDPEHEPAAAEVIRQAEDFRLSRGFMVPVAGPAAGCEGGVWIGGYHLALGPNEKPLVHLLALYAFDHIRALSRRCETKTPCLTSREREVLTWAAAGKTASQIGDILHITTRTVNEHAQTAKRKLGAANRTQAIATAIREHLIQL